MNQPEKQQPGNAVTPHPAESQEEVAKGKENRYNCTGRVNSEPASQDFKLQCMTQTLWLCSALFVMLLIFTNTTRAVDNRTEIFSNAGQSLE